MTNRENMIAQAAWTFVEQRREFGIADEDIRREEFGILRLLCDLNSRYTVCIDELRAAVEAELA